MLDEDTLLRVRRAEVESVEAAAAPSNEGTPATREDAGTSSPDTGGGTFDNLKDKLVKQLEKLPCTSTF